MPPQSHAQSPYLYSFTHVPGKGMGIVANYYIRRGTRIISDAPLFKIPNYTSDPAAVTTHVTKELKGKSKDEQRMFLSLFNAYPKDYMPFYGITKTNALPLGPDSEHAGLFLTVARLNHSCSPNASHAWNSNTGTETIHAIRDILRGEEVTICYIGSDKSCRDREGRRKELAAVFKFECHCTVCDLAPEQSLASDKRRAEIEKLDEIVGQGDLLMLHAATALNNCRTMLHLMDEERIYDKRVSGIYYDAFQICIANGDVARASAFARRTVEERMLCEGPDAVGLEDQKALIDNPQNHKLAGLSNVWKTGLEDIREYDDQEEFNVWLWKRADS
ncbi:hypothetical protein B9Z19DRAFT_1067790 [Tuber borchii]|uniref:SET domain-containing protein n=1 Tax=Tuber borchii TaxID=42251 RepID=A0A2T6ZHN1_TUBBO|nr:hypothetical protein B9Z19DRAFT_1067790 [Tuber borchii]